MLSQDELIEALHEGLKQAEKCSNTFCRASAVIENEGYLIAHNGISSGDTDVQAVHASKTLGMNKEQLAERIKTWVAGLHTGVRLDLNAVIVETRGPAVLGWPWHIRYDYTTGLTTGTITYTATTTTNYLLSGDPSWRVRGGA